MTQLGVSGGVFWNSVVQGLYIQDVWMGRMNRSFSGL